MRAREIQAMRFSDENHIHCNAQMTPRMLSRWARPTPEAMGILEHAMLKFDMSARAYDRILKVARTISHNRRPPHQRGSFLPHPRPLLLGS